MTETIKFWRATGTGPIAETFTPGEAAKILQVQLTLPQASSDHAAFLAEHSSAAGSIFNSPYFSLGIQYRRTARTNEVLYIGKGDDLEFSWPNADGLEWGLEVAYMEMDYQELASPAKEVADPVTESTAQEVPVEGGTENVAPASPAEESTGAVTEPAPEAIPAGEGAK